MAAATIVSQSRQLHREAWQLTANGAESYEKFQVPSIFDPLARVFLDRIPVRRGQRVLDVACGTGILARHLADPIGDQGRLVGIDLNEAMLDIAAREAPAGGAPTEWHHGDATALPYDDAAFDLVLCQQGLQFFPDRLAALGEMYRVLATGGRLAICVWNSLQHSPVNQAAAAALGRHAGKEAARRIRAPFALGDEALLRRLIAAAGFSSVAIQEAVVVRLMLPADQSIPGHLASTPVGPAFAALDHTLRQRIVNQIATALRPYQHPAGLAIPQGTLIATAIK